MDDGGREALKKRSNKGGAAKIYLTPVPIWGPEGRSAHVVVLYLLTLFL